MSYIEIHDQRNGFWNVSPGFASKMGIFALKIKADLESVASMKWDVNNQWCLVVQNPTTEERCEAYFSKVRQLLGAPSGVLTPSTGAVLLALASLRTKIE